MKLWILRAREDLPATRLDNPWEPPWDKADGFVVRAPTEPEAREWAQKGGGDETGGYFSKDKVPAWTDPAFSTCVELPIEGEEGTILMSFNAG